VAATPTLPGPVEVTKAVRDLSIAIGFIPQLAAEFTQLLRLQPGASSSFNQFMMIAFHVSPSIIFQILEWSKCLVQMELVCDLYGKSESWARHHEWIQLVAKILMTPTILIFPPRH
jgi:hypothetical protein